MEFTKTVESRRSVRHFKESGLSLDQKKEKLSEMIDFARVNAPSWKNSQTHRYFAAVSDEKMKAVTETLWDRNQPKCTNAVGLIVSCFEKNVSGFTGDTPDNELGNEWGAYDLGLSDSILLLKARDMGLDTLVMGLRDSDKIRGVFDIPQNYEVAAVISVGIREKDEVPAPGHKELSEIAVFA